jgi:hypothetical protein
MHFDPRTQSALREVGLDGDAVRRASELVTEAVREDAAAIESFFEGRETVHSDMDRAHSTADVQEHAVAFLDAYTHGADLRGYLRFDSWGVPVEGGRVLSETTVELTLGPPVHDRVRFAADPEALR